MKLTAITFVMLLGACSPQIVEPKQQSYKPSTPAQIIDQCKSQPELPWCVQARGGMNVKSN